MAITNGYCTLAQLKAALSNMSGTDNDAELESIIEAASRQIDVHCGRVFYDEGAVTRYFTARHTDRFDFEDETRFYDLQSLTTLKTDNDNDRVYETTWAATDYDLEPVNSSPKWRLRTRSGGDYSLPTNHRGVEIAGNWGFASVPRQIERACLLQAERLWKRRDAPFGVLENPDFASARIPALDPDVKRLLANYRLMVLV